MSLDGKSVVTLAISYCSSLFVLFAREMKKTCKHKCGGAGEIARDTKSPTSKKKKDKCNYMLLKCFCYVLD